MSKTYRLTERAEADVGAIADFIAGDSVDAAVKVVLALEDAFGLLASRPGIGHARHDRNQERRRCGLCRKILCAHDSISIARVGDRCCRCFNDETADQLGVDFDNTAMPPFAITDVDGVQHRFEIRSMLVPTGHAMYAREVGKLGAKGGYRFEILGDLEADAHDLFTRLRDRIRQALSVRHVEETENGWQITRPHRLSGVIEWDAGVAAIGAADASDDPP